VSGVNVFIAVSAVARAAAVGECNPFLLLAPVTPTNHRTRMAAAVHADQVGLLITLRNLAIKIVTADIRKSTSYSLNILDVVLTTPTINQPSNHFNIHSSSCHTTLKEELMSAIS